MIFCILFVFICLMASVHVNMLSVISGTLVSYFLDTRVEIEKYATVMENLVLPQILFICLMQTAIILYF